MFKNKKNIEILKKALDVIAREQAATLPTAEESRHITFSSEFEEKMQKLIKKESKPYYYLINTVGKRVACIIIAALIALTSITFGVKAIREAVIDFFVETFEKFSIVGFKDEDIPSSLDSIETYYAPTYIPEGYELKKDKKFKTYRVLSYVSGNNCIYFRQNLIDNCDTYIDTENAQTEEIAIFDGVGFYCNKDEITQLYWIDTDYNYYIYSNSIISKAEIVKIAESIRAE